MANTFRFANKIELAMAIQAIQISIESNVDMSTDTNLTMDGRIDMMVNAGHGNVVLFILKEQQAKAVMGTQLVALSTELYAVLETAVSGYCDMCSDTFDDEPPTNERIRQLIALNRLDERM